MLEYRLDDSSMRSILFLTDCVCHYVNKLTYPSALEAKPLLIQSLLPFVPYDIFGEALYYNISYNEVITDKSLKVSSKLRDISKPY